MNREMSYIQIPAKILEKCLLRRDMLLVTPMLQLFGTTSVLQIVRDLKVCFITKNCTISFTMVVEAVILQACRILNRNSEVFARLG